MSHFTTIQTQIKDLGALREAVQELGLTLIPNAQARGYLTNTLHGQFVIRLKGPYDIALNPQPDGTFGLACDWWEGHVEREVGTSFGHLLQLYAVHKSTREARKRGLRVQRTLRTDGSIKLSIGGIR